MAAVTVVQLAAAYDLPLFNGIAVQRRIAADIAHIGNSAHIEAARTAALGSKGGGIAFIALAADFCRDLPVIGGVQFEICDLI